MSIPGKDFFVDNEVLFVGFSRNQKSFCRIPFKQFQESGIKVYPVSNKKVMDSNVNVYNLDEMSYVPKTAYVILNKENTAKIIEDLHKKGVKRILFQSKQTVSRETLDKCSELGMETAVACPMMILSKGLVHRIHAYFERKKK